MASDKALTWHLTWLTDVASNIGFLQKVYLEGSPDVCYWIDGSIFIVPSSDIWVFIKLAHRFFHIFGSLHIANL
jgi:hypothetical protein